MSRGLLTYSSFNHEHSPETLDRPKYMLVATFSQWVISKLQWQWSSHKNNLWLSNITQNYKWIFILFRRTILSLCRYIWMIDLRFLGLSAHLFNKELNRRAGFPRVTQPVRTAKKKVDEKAFSYIKRTYNVPQRILQLWGGFSSYPVVVTSPSSAGGRSDPQIWAEIPCLQLRTQKAKLK